MLFHASELHKYTPFWRDQLRQALGGVPFQVDA